MIHTVETYILLFFIYAIGGWLMEVICKLIQKGKFINRGFLIGPYCPIYGYGAILITLLLKKYTDDPIALFVMGVVICSILEYTTSYFMEKKFHARWWDYSKYPFNINGRIWLRTMIPFGLLGMFIMYVSNPFLLNLIRETPEIILNIATIVLVTIYIVDNIVSSRIISNVHITGKKIKDNTEEITEKIAEDITRKVKVILSKRSVLHRRLVEAFPEMKMKINQKKSKRINWNLTRFQSSTFANKILYFNINFC